MNENWINWLRKSLKWSIRIISMKKLIRMKNGAKALAKVALAFAVLVYFSSCYSKHFLHRWSVASSLCYQKCFPQLLIVCQPISTFRPGTVFSEMWNDKLTFQLLMILVHILIQETWRVLDLDLGDMACFRGLVVQDVKLHDIYFSAFPLSNSHRHSRKYWNTAFRHTDYSARLAQPSFRGRPAGARYGFMGSNDQESPSGHH